MTNYKWQYLREKYQVTEYKDGCVYRTKNLGRVWTDERDTYKLDSNDIGYHPISTKDMKFSQTMRKVSVDTPSEVPAN